MQACEPDVEGYIEHDGIKIGYEVFEKTPLADPNVDYFPTGDRFLPPELRRDLIRAALEERLRRR